MRKYIIAILSLIFTFGNTYSEVTLSDMAEISLLTCEPGEKVYEKFGHTGIRVSDPENGIDMVFHWGIFSFSSPNFIGRFVSGRPIYEMGIFRTEYFMSEYIRRQSTVHSQTLNYTKEQKQSLWDALMENYEPENRHYKYNFIYDNCATRPYHMLIKEYGTSIRHKYTQKETTFRELINKHIEQNSWLNTGINIIIGSDADKAIGTLSTISFPVYTMLAMNKSYYEKDGELHPIIKYSDNLYQAPQKEKIPYWVYTINIIIPIALILLTVLYYWKKRHYVPYLTPILLIISGLMSIVIMYLWFGSEHPLVDENYNLLWLNPVNLVLGIMMLIRHKIIRIKAVVSVISLALTLIFTIAIIFNLQSTTSMLFCTYIMMIATLTTIVMTYAKALSSLGTKHHHTHHHHHKVSQTK